jgi:hypothetical protein
MTNQLIILLASTACIMALGMLINFILEICVPDIQATSARDEIPFLKTASSAGMHKQVALCVYAATDHGTLTPLKQEAPGGGI